MRRQKKAYIIVGMGYGDEGKGTMTDFLCRYHNAKLVVRYNGGPQAAHNVVLPDGTHHTFAQFGSGSFISGTKTILWDTMIVDPIALCDETSILSKKIKINALENLLIHPFAPIVTPIHIAANRIKEWTRGNFKHGSCGKGVGETSYDLWYHPNEVIRMNFLKDKSLTTQILEEIQERKRKELESLNVDITNLPDHHKELLPYLFNQAECQNLASNYKQMYDMFPVALTESKLQRLIDANESVVFEGAQGILLDQWHGFHPFTTWSDITPTNAFRILERCGLIDQVNCDIEVIGVTRTYATRHGAGPLPTEAEELTHLFDNEHNKTNEHQGIFRIGYLDLVTLKYAADCIKSHGHLSAIALTHCDSFEKAKRNRKYVCSSHFYHEHDLDLKVSHKHDLRYQGTITASLDELDNPDYIFGLEQDGVIQEIEERLDVPVKYLSHGPTWKDKKTLEK